MKILLRFATIALLVPLVNAADPAPASDAAVSVQVDWNPTDTLPENALWLAYLTSRATYVGEHKAAYDQKSGIVTPLFAEELAARSDVVQVYRELKQKDAKLKVAYFDDLVRVADRSFMSEYVWTYLFQPDWGTPPDNLHLVDFMNWRAKNLAQHSAMTKGAIRLVGKDGAQQESTPAQSDAMPVLSRARDILQRGDAQTAIAGYLDPVIEYFERLHQDTTTRFYAARNQQQAFVYVAMPNEGQQRTVVLDSTWSDAYLMKAYGLVELRKLAEAETALQHAISLSPLNAQYISELAFIYQAQGQCEKSIATYQQAESAAGLGSEDSTKTADLTLAWRGQGYCLVELGRFDEAEKLYKKCLALDPSDNKAKGELDYIKKARR